MSPRGKFAYGSLAALWAVFFCLLTFASRELGVATTTAVFAVSAGAVLLGLARLTGRRLDWRLNWGEVLVWAALSLAMVLATVIALSSLGAALTAIVISAIPLFTTVTGQVRGTERVTGLGAISLLLGILGLVLVASSPAARDPWSFLGGILAGLAAAIVAGGSGKDLVARIHRPRAVETLAVSALLAGVAASVFVPFCPPSRPVGWAPLLVIILAGGCAFLALFAMSSASDSVPMRVAATLPGVGTVLAAIAGAVFLAESVSIVQWLGMVLILAGTALVRGLIPAWFPASWRA